MTRGTRFALFGILYAGGQEHHVVLAAVSVRGARQQLTTLARTKGWTVDRPHEVYALRYPGEWIIRSGVRDEGGRMVETSR